MVDKKPDLHGVKILVADEDAAFVAGLKQSLSGFGAEVFTASSEAAAAEALTFKEVDVIAGGAALFQEAFVEKIGDYLSANPGTLLYVITNKGEFAEPAAESSPLRPDEYLQKPVDPVRLSQMIETSLGRPGTGSTSLAIIEPLVPKVKPYFIFRSAAMRRALYKLPEIAASGQTVLISGETGTGKELVARAVHVLSRRSSGTFVPINCGAIPESLIEGELFGHEKGAFTGAYMSRKGKFEAANNGTLFLDEIGDMPLDLQVRLLRVLEEQKVYRVGGEKPVPVDVRVIAATRVELEKGVKDGLFREDLYYRLNVLRIHLPPLRERVDDIPLLALHFLERAFSEMGRVPPYPSLSNETIYVLERIPWRGNVRELRNVMTRIATLLPAETKRIFPFHILPHLEDSTGGEPLTEVPREKNGIVVPVGATLHEAEKLLIQNAIRKTGGNRTRAAKILGISVRTLRRKLNEL